MEQFMKRFAGLLIVFLLSSAAFGLAGGGGGRYYPPQTKVNTIGISKVPLAKCFAENYIKVYSFKEETEDEWWKRNYRAERIFNRTYVGYLVETRFLGEDWFVYCGDDYLKITSAYDRSRTAVQFSPPRYVYALAAFPQRLKGKEFLVVYVRQQPSSHSSTLLIFDEKFRIVYQDHLLGALEIGHAGDKIVVKSENFWYPNGGKRVDTNGDWVYFIP